MELLQNLRSYKIFDMAMFDWIATILVAWWVSDKYQYAFWNALIVLIILAIVIHWVTNTPTMLNAYIGINTKEDVYDARGVNQ